VGLSPEGEGGLFELEFRRVFDQEFQSLFRYANRWSGDPARAADVAQETFIRLYRRGRLPEELRAWLVSVATNLLRDERRRDVRRERLLSTHVITDATERRPDTDVLAEERRHAVRAALDDLEPRDRALLLLRHEGYSYRELAAALRIRDSSVGTLLARARERFRVALGRRHDALD
jgi:RNA polymerase sigma-70 factor, ECF subfamily